MSSFTLTFSTDGAAFAEHPYIEIARLLREAADVADTTLPKNAASALASSVRPPARRTISESRSLLLTSV